MPAFLYSLTRGDLSGQMWWGRYTPELGGEPSERTEPLVIGAEPVPAVELHGLRRQLHHAGLRQPGQDGVECLLLAHARVESLVAAEACGDPERLAAQLAKPWERLEEELLVRDRLPDLERRVPSGEHREVVMIEF